MTSEEIVIRLDLALARAKHIQRESRENVRQLAQLLEAAELLVDSESQQKPTAEKAQGENNGTESKEQ